MKQKGHCIVGDIVSVDSFTSNWLSVKLHPATFYRRMNEFQESFKLVKGLYAELDLGQYVVIRFSEKDDVTAFHRCHHEYL